MLWNIFLGCDRSRDRSRPWPWKR